MVLQVQQVLPSILSAVVVMMMPSMVMVVRSKKKKLGASLIPRARCVLTLARRLAPLAAACTTVVRFDACHGVGELRYSATT